MRPQDHESEALRVGRVTTHLVRDADGATAAVALLDRAEAAAGIPLVDESERRRIGDAADAAAQVHHHAVIARTQDETCVGYAGLVVPPADEHGVGDVAVAPEADDDAEVLQALLHAIDHVALTHEAHGTELWKRRASTGDVATAIAAGYAVERRLHVLGRRLDDAATGGATARDDAPPAADDRHGDDGLDDGTVLRGMQPDDVDGVVAVLAAAYDGTADGGWDRDRFEERTAHDWFDPRDVRVAVVDGHVEGIHWTKQRGGGVGEVYNLAVHPRAQGRRLGRRLLRDGLAHLAERGCDDVLLWVDTDNESALRLYVTHGFRARWEDVAFRRHTSPPARHHHLADGVPLG